MKRRCQDLEGEISKLRKKNKHTYADAVKNNLQSEDPREHAKDAVTFL